MAFLDYTGLTRFLNKLKTIFAAKTDTVLDTTLSRGRKASTTVGEGSFAFGNDVEASGIYTHAEGSSTTASGSDAHAEGWFTVASAANSHAEGYHTTASFTDAHAEGNYTTASGADSHAEGMSTTALGSYSHAEGFYTTANHKSQHVSGEYNVLDSSSAQNYNRGNYVEIIGNGTEYDARSNARTLDWSGNERLKGDLYVNCNADSSGGTAVGTTLSSHTQAIVMHSPGSTLSTIADLKTFINSVFQDYTDGWHVHWVSFKCNEAPFSGITYSGFVFGDSSDYKDGLFAGLTSNASSIAFSQRSTNWSFEQLASNQAIANKVNTSDKVLIDRNTNSSCADCNAVTDVGMYRIINTTANRPPFNYGVMLHLQSNDYIRQLAIGSSREYFVRRKISTGWSNWERLSTSIESVDASDACANLDAIKTYLLSVANTFGTSRSSTDVCVRTGSGTVTPFAQNSAYYGRLYGTSSYCNVILTSYYSASSIICVYNGTSWSIKTITAT